jgi:hypothetical protein
MPKPRRLRLSRHKGFKLQAASRSANGLAAVTVARPSRWGNPFVIGRDGTQARCVSLYRQWVKRPRQKMLRDKARAALKGKNLACWCAPGTPCHADVLLALVN